jgi:hypothetical protein
MSISNQPPEILAEILSYTSVYDVQNIELVCKTWKDAWYTASKYNVSEKFKRKRDNKFFLMCKEGGRVDELGNFVKRFDVGIDDVKRGSNSLLRSMCLYNNMGIVNWLMIKFKLDVDDLRSNGNDTFKISCCRNDLVLTRWALKNCNITLEDVLCNSPHERKNWLLMHLHYLGRVEVLEFLCEYFGKALYDHPHMVLGKQHAITKNLQNL